MSQELHRGFELASDGGSEKVASRPFFSLPTILGAYVLVGGVLFGLVTLAAMHRTVLIQPIDPNFHALMIGLGVFVGVLLAVFTAAGRLAGIGGRQSALTAVTIVPLMIIAMCGFAGSYAAERVVEWRAFHGVTPRTVDRDFSVISVRSGKSGPSLRLQPTGSDFTIGLGCTWAVYRKVSVGDHLTLPVEIGRYGVERTQMTQSPTITPRAD